MKIYSLEYTQRIKGKNEFKIIRIPARNLEQAKHLVGRMVKARQAQLGTIKQV